MIKKYAFIWSLFLSQVAFFLILPHGRLFNQSMSIITILELGYVATFSKAFVSIKKLFPSRIAEARVRYVPAAVGMLGFVGIGIGFFEGPFIVPIGIISALLTAVGKTLVFRHIDNLGIVT